MRSPKKVANRVDEAPTLESVVSLETSMKKYFFFIDLLTFSREVLQKMEMQNLFFANIVKHRFFYHARYRIFTILGEKS